MATATKQNGTTTEPAERPIDKLKKMLGEMTSLIESLLPAEVKGRAEWFTNRAMLTFKRGNAKLQQCSMSSFVQAVVNGAELGLPIDGKLGYAVPYNNKKKDAQGRESFVMEAQFQPSYIGLKVVAKRSGQILDAYAELVHQGDSFKHAKMGDKCMIEHTWDILVPRGPVVCVYGIVKLPGDDWNYEIMTLADLDVIRNRSKSKNDGPWVTDPNEMRKKTVLRRVLKTYCSDPGFIMAAQYDESEFENDDIGAGHGSRRAIRSPLNETLGLPSPKQRSQFERDMESGILDDDRELVESTKADPAEQGYQHAEPVEVADEQAATQEPPEEPVDGKSLLNLLESKLDSAFDIPSARSAESWWAEKQVDDDTKRRGVELITKRKGELRAKK